MRQHCVAPLLSRKLGVMTKFTPPRFFSSLMAAAILILLVPVSQANAQSQQDGLGRVEYDEGASDNIPTYTPTPRRSTVPSSATPVRSRNGQPVVGRKAAEKYMAPKKDESRQAERESGAENHIMTVYIGSFVNDHSYKTGGNDSLDNAANLNLGLSYRFGEWTNVADINGALEYTTYSLRGKSVQKLSLLPKISFPDVSSHFPLYFGLGAGLGIFTKQLHAESAISFDYQVFAGLRFLNVFPQTGFFVETGLKNQILLLSDGQFNGWFISLGAIFAF